MMKKAELTVALQSRAGAEEAPVESALRLFRLLLRRPHRHQNLLLERSSTFFCQLPSSNDFEEKRGENVRHWS
ncbi:hypothetical protein TYRP_003851 [Tyrophagus putrescentiae]|nr:hypothetical protein TYRP_003851 [Tyrophagus putrescentiae]